METWTWTWTWNFDVLQKNQMENGSLDNFPSSVYRLLSCKQKFVISLFVDEETIRSYPFANGLNGLTNLPIYAYSFPNGKRIKSTEYNNHLFMLET
jgi:hypothetical protein